MNLCFLFSLFFFLLLWFLFKYKKEVWWHLVHPVVISPVRRSCSALKKLLSDEPCISSGWYACLWTHGLRIVASFLSIMDRILAWSLLWMLALFCIFFPVLNVSIFISSPLPYEFVGKVGPAIVNLSLFLYILEGMTSTSTMIIFIRLKLEQNRYPHAVWSCFVWEPMGGQNWVCVCCCYGGERLAVAPSHVSFTHKGNL